MVWDASKKTVARKERKVITGKLIGLQSDKLKSPVFDAENGKYSWIKASLVLPEQKNGQDQYFNTVFYDVDMSIMPELLKADSMLLNKIKPMVTFEYYEVVKDCTDAEGQPVFEEVEEERNGRIVIVQKPKKWNFNRCSKDDIKNTFQILSE